MDPAEALAGVAIRQAPQTWASYERLVRIIVEQVRPVNIVLLAVCTPQQLTDWPHGKWLLLDCADDERRARLAPRSNAAERTKRSPMVPFIGRSGSRCSIAQIWNPATSPRQLPRRLIRPSRAAPSVVANP